MTDDFRRHLDLMATEDLVAILRDHDLDEWRPEVFPIVESILQERGVDVAVVTASPLNREGPEGVNEKCPEDASDLIEIADIHDPAMLPVVASVLEQAGIEFFIRNEKTQNLFGLGQIGGGYNLITGAPTLLVAASKLQEAKDLLEPLFAEKDAGPEDE